MQTFSSDVYLPTVLRLNQAVKECYKVWQHFTSHYDLLCHSKKQIHWEYVKFLGWVFGFRPKIPLQRKRC